MPENDCCRMLMKRGILAAIRARCTRITSPTVRCGNRSTFCPSIEVVTLKSGSFSVVDHSAQGKCSKVGSTTTKACRDQPLSNCGPCLELSHTTAQRLASAPSRSVQSQLWYLYTLPAFLAGGSRNHSGRSRVFFFSASSVSLSRR